MDNPVSGRCRLLIWPILPVLITGLLITWFSAWSVRDHAEDRARQLLATHHQALTDTLSAGISNLVFHGRQLAAESGRDNFRELSGAFSEDLDGVVAVEILDTVPQTIPHWARAISLALEEGIITATSATETNNGGSMTSTLGVYFPTRSGSLVGITLAPVNWLGNQFSAPPPDGLDIAVHDLSRHSKTPLAQFEASSDLVSEEALRSELAFANRVWMLTTTPTRGFFASASRRSFQMVWLAGTLMTALALVLTSLLVFRLGRREKKLAQLSKTIARLEQHLDNKQVEKMILKQALSNSELRSRDLVALTGGFVCELDENLHIAYISPQVTQILERPPADLAEQPFEKWVAEADGRNFRSALDAARQEKQMERIDLKLISGTGLTVAVTLRIKAVIDPISGCIGFRMTGQTQSA